MGCNLVRHHPRTAHWRGRNALDNHKHAGETAVDVAGAIVLAAMASLGILAALFL
jgi:hypothetical protein